MESCELIVGVDFTQSNTFTGKASFGGQCLHSLSTGVNPYEHAISAIARALRDFDDDNLIPAFGFGDRSTGDKSVFHFNKGGEPCLGLEGVLKRYRELAAPGSGLELSGPTSFAPLIRQAIHIVRSSGHRFHLLVIVADGAAQRSIRESIKGQQTSALDAANVLICFPNRH